MRKRTIPPVHCVYIVCCADGTLYTGYARDPTARTRLHNAGRGAKYTAGRRPVRLVYAEAFNSRSKALKREHEIKRWPRAKKDALLVVYSGTQGEGGTRLRPD